MEHVTPTLDLHGGGAECLQTGGAGKAHPTAAPQSSRYSAGALFICSGNHQYNPASVRGDARGLH